VTRHAIIVGAGIGGLNAALSLAKAGFVVRVIEQAPTLAEAGAGIQLAPNATRVLQWLGVLPAVRFTAFVPEAIELRDVVSGDVTLSKALGDAAATCYGAPYLSVHRADLQRALLDAARACPHIALSTGTTCSRVDADAAAPSVTLTDGSRITADVVIGADGIHSAVRRSLFGDDAPRFTGCVAWRGLVPVSALGTAAPRPVSTVWMGAGAHFVHYYVRGGALVNYVAVTERADWREESWSVRGDPRELAAAFANWPAPVPQLITATPADDCYRWALYDRPPMPQWGCGAVTLLGDACHPSLPFAAQGANMAIEDAAVLANCLSEGADIPAALRRYGQLRQPRTADVQRMSSRNRTLYHLAGISAAGRRFGAPLMRGAFSRTLDGLFGYDATMAR